MAQHDAKKLSVTTATAEAMTTATRISHPLHPVFDDRSRVLVLGTMPSPKSRQAGFYYGHPQNRFWKVLARLLDEPIPTTNQRKIDFLLRHGIALWDVLASCDIVGASDASIRNAVPNDLLRILNAAPIQAVFCTGATATRLYRKHCEPATGIPCVQLPSTSPANAACKMPALLEAYSAILPHLEDLPTPAGGLPQPLTLNVADVVALEQRIAASGTDMHELMDRAGMQLAHKVKKFLSNKCQNAVILCGSGNNGGDGWVCARELLSCCAKVTVVTPKAPEALSAEPARTTALEVAALLDAASNAEILANPNAVELERVFENALAGGTSEDSIGEPGAGAAGKSATRKGAAAGVIVDAVLGTGFNGNEVRDPYATWIRLANKYASASMGAGMSAGADATAGAAIVAADVPSGLSAQTGVAADPCIKADATVTMMVSKPGLKTLEDSGTQQPIGPVTVVPLIDLRSFFS